MRINKNAVLVGTDGSEVKVLSHVNSRGNCVVRVLKAGEYLDDELRPIKEGAILKGFDVYHGLIKFVEKGSGVFYRNIISKERVAA